MPTPWRARIRQLRRRRLALIATLIIGGGGLGFWLIGMKQTRADSNVLDLSDVGPKASHTTAVWHQQTGR
jgi:hypothetical protein